MAIMFTRMDIPRIKFKVRFHPYIIPLTPENIMTLLITKTDTTVHKDLSLSLSHQVPVLLISNYAPLAR